MKTTYKGVTTEVNDNLLVPDKKYKNPPRKSYKFDVLSLYYNGTYYFPSDIKESKENHCNLPYEIQVVYHQGKWYQDTQYISEQFKNFLLENL